MAVNDHGYGASSGNNFGCREMIALKHKKLSYRAKLCSVNDKDGSLDLDLVNFQQVNQKQKTNSDQDIYISGLSIEPSSLTGESNPISSPINVEKITFDQSLILKLKKALQKFRRCLLKKQGSSIHKQESKDCEINGFLKKISVDSDKMVSIEVDQLKNGALKVTKMTFESLFNIKVNKGSQQRLRRGRRSIARPTIFVPKACLDVERFKCFGGTQVTRKPRLAKISIFSQLRKLNTEIRQNMKKKTFVKVTLRKRYGLVPSSNVPKRRRQNRSITVHYHGSSSSSHVTSHTALTKENINDENLFQNGNNAASQTIGQLYDSFKALSKF